MGLGCFTNSSSVLELPLIHRLLPSRAQPFLQNSLAWEIQACAYLYPISV